MKYECAKQYFAEGQYAKAMTLFGDQVTIQKGTENAQECLYMLGMAAFGNKDYDAASEYFKKYSSSYPRGVYAEKASFYQGESLYQSTPEPRLDQTPTVNSINAFQSFLDVHNDSDLKPRAQERLSELFDKLVRKELYTSKMYFDLGSYFGNCTNGGSNYEAAIISAQNAIKDYPYTQYREEFYLIIMKAKYQLARQSVSEKRAERFRDAEDECYGFINEFPDSESRSLAEKYIAVCKKYAKGEMTDEDFR